MCLPKGMGLLTGSFTAPCLSFPSTSRDAARAGCSLQVQHQKSSDVPRQLPGQH